MNSQQPFITIDQNQLRRPAALAAIAEVCREKELRLLVSDGSFQEFAKSERFFETAKRSLESLCPYRELICMARPIKALIADELTSAAPSVTLVNDGTTDYLRSLLAALEKSDGEELRELADGPVKRLMPSALAVWNDHDEKKVLIQALHDAFQRDMPAEQLKSLRQSPETAASEWLSSLSGIRFVFQWLQTRGFGAKVAYDLTQAPCVAVAFTSALAGLAIDWIAFGGIESAQPLVLSGDLYDIEYIVLGSLCRSLATADQRAARVCRAVADGFTTRQSLPQTFE